jgi:two-component system, NtrC family, response regulator AtoC
VTPSVLIIEDERVLAHAMRDYLADHGYEPTVAGSAEEGLPEFRQAEADIVLLDYRLPGLDGLATLREIRQLAPQAAVVMLTAHGTVKTAVEAMRAGAFDYLTKPVDLEELVLVLDKAWSHVSLRREVGFLRQSGGHGEARRRLVGESVASRGLRAQIERLATLDQSGGTVPPILITGETGTGKGLIARMLHDLGPRGGKAFVEVNCAAIPATLLESEMFGYERGAFTDARSAKPGLFEAADGGSLFLDEIGAMSLDLQVKLLKVLEEKSVRRLGGLRPKALDVQIVAATNADLDAAVQAGTFRADLLYRLKVLTLALPPLRERRDDVVPLAWHFTELFSQRYRRPRRLTAAAEQALRAYSWPGNIRELSNVIERAVFLEEQDSIGPETLGLSPPRPAAAVDVSADGVHVDFSGGGVSLVAVEKTLLIEALKASGGHRRRAAELLDISFETLRYRLEKYGLVTRTDDTGA